MTIYGTEVDEQTQLTIIWKGFEDEWASHQSTKDFQSIRAMLSLMLKRWWRN